MQRIDGCELDLVGCEEEYKKNVERIVKANREILVLSTLMNRSICGYDLIKEILIKSNVFLSQGSVYPILYSLEEEGILFAEFSKGDMRAKKYSFTPEGRIIAQRKLAEFVRAMEDTLELVKATGLCSKTL